MYINNNLTWTTIIHITYCYQRLVQMANFQSLPGELRNQIYEHLLVSKEAIKPLASPQQHSINSGILYVNKKIHHEACSMLYSRNLFNFTPQQNEDQISRFIIKIGHTNAASIESIRLSLPTFTVDKSNLFMSIIWQAMIGIIASHCNNLKVIRLDTELLVDGCCIESAIRRPLVDTIPMIDSQLRLIPSLTKIVAELIEKNIEHGIKEKMKSFSWLIRR